MPLASSVKTPGSDSIVVHSILFLFGKIIICFISLKIYKILEIQIDPSFHKEPENIPFVLKKDYLNPSSSFFLSTNTSSNLIHPLR